MKPYALGIELEWRARLKLQPKPMVFRDHTLVSALNEAQVLGLITERIMRDKVDRKVGKKWVYLERNTLHRRWAISEGESGLTIWHG